MYNLKPSAVHLEQLLDRTAMIETTLSHLQRDHVVEASEVAAEGGLVEIANTVRPHAEGAVIGALATWLACMLGLEKPAEG